MRNGVPQDVVIHEVISVDEAVPHADDFGPGDLRVLRPYLCRHLAGGFSNQLYEVGEREAQLLVAALVPTDLSLDHRDSLARIVTQMQKPHFRITFGHIGPAPRPAHHRGNTCSGFLVC